MIILGAGGHAKVVIAAAHAAGMNIDGIYDDSPEKQGADIFGVPILGPISSAPTDAEAVIAIGSNAVRAELANRLNLNWTTIIHPTAWVHESVEIGPGTVIFAGAVIQPDAKIGRHAIINTCASVDHDCIVGAFAQISPGVALAGSVNIGQGAFIGTGASIIPGVSIGSGAVLGAGGVATRDLPANSLAVGVPAKVI
jgi:UDP-perosamine 4-acetyltransferase